MAHALPHLEPLARPGAAIFRLVGWEGEHLLVAPLQGPAEAERARPALPPGVCPR